MERCDQRNQQGGNPRQLKDIVDLRQRPVILNCEEEMHEKDGDERQNDAS